MAPASVNSERLWILIARKLSEECTPEELKELDLLLEADPPMIDRLEMLTRLWNIPLT